MADKHAAGTFCWVDLMTSDRDAGGKFYSDVLGWSYQETPMPGDMPGTYKMIQNADAALGGMNNISDEQKSMGVPPHWNAYVAVDNVDATVAKCKELGGKAMMEGFDIPDTGRMAVLADPTGATFSIWQNTSQHAGSGQTLGTVGAPCWAELVTDNIDAAGSFYSALFDWAPEASKIPDVKYTTFKRGETSAAGMLAKSEQMGPMPNAWVVYWLVADCDETVKKIEANGGKTFFPPRDIPSVGRFTWMADPQGAVSGVIKMEMGG